MRRAAGLQAQPAQFRGAAADIEDDGLGDIAVEQRRAALEGEIGLLAGGDDVEGDAGLVADAVDEAAAILRPAAGFGGDGARQAHPAALHLGRTDLERLDGAVHRFGGQAAALRDALAQPDDARKRVDDLIAGQHPCRAISSRQLLVPKSRAAMIWPGLAARVRHSAGAGDPDNAPFTR